MIQFQFVKGANQSQRNTIPLEAKQRALELIDKQNMTAKESLVQIAKEFHLDNRKASWTKYAGSTINRFRAELKVQVI